MISFPVVWLVSVLSAIAAWALAGNARVPGHARVFLCGFLAALATVAFLLGLRLSAESALAARLQPLVAVLAAPCAWLGFQGLTRETGPAWTRLVIITLAVAGLTMAGIVAAFPVSPDVFVLGLNTVMLVLIARMLRLREDQFAGVSPGAMSMVRASLWATVSLLGFMVAADGLILAIGAFSGEPHLMEMLTGLSGVFAGFAFVAALIAVPMLLRSPEERKEQGKSEPTDADEKLMTRLDALMRGQKLFRDSGLTLARVARRLGVPARDVSGATNRTTGENFSRYINGFRISYAQDALLKDDLPVTEIMFEAGFISKSSFNAEFRRVTGQTPSAWRKNRG